MLRPVKINRKIAFVNVIEIENIATNKNIIGMFLKTLITNYAQCSLLKFTNLVSVAVQVRQNERVKQINQSLLRDKSSYSI